MHAIRRIVDINILLFNNRIYGLTKGQYSPTSELGKATKSTPNGTPDYPVDPAAFAIGSSGTFVARSIDTDAKHLAEVLKRAAEHVGTAFIEIYQNCIVFNDEAFDAFAARANRDEHTLRVEHGKPLLFGTNRDKGLLIDPQTLGLKVGKVGEDGITEKDFLIHDQENSTLAYMLARMPFPAFPVAVGVLYAHERPTYGANVRALQEAAKQRGKPDLQKLLSSGNTWEV
jgi:2-oxoglutarate ferredoxin oxidoreductase subunit beta